MTETDFRESGDNARVDIRLMSEIKYKNTFTFLETQAWTTPSTWRSKSMGKAMMKSITCLDMLKSKRVIQSKATKTREAKTCLFDAKKFFSKSVHLTQHTLKFKRRRHQKEEDIWRDLKESRGTLACQRQKGSKSDDSGKPVFSGSKVALFCVKVSLEREPAKKSQDF